MLPAATIAENIPLRTAVAAMTTEHQRQLLVLDEDGFRCLMRDMEAEERRLLYVRICLPSHL